MIRAFFQWLYLELLAPPSTTQPLGACATFVPVADVGAWSASVDLCATCGLSATAHGPAVVVPQPGTSAPITDTTPEPGHLEAVLVWWPTYALDDEGELTDRLTGGRWVISSRFENGEFPVSADMDADWDSHDGEQFGLRPLAWSPLPETPARPSAEARR